MGTPQKNTRPILDAHVRMYLDGAKVILIVGVPGRDSVTSVFCVGYRVCQRRDFALRLCSS